MWFRLGLAVCVCLGLSQLCLADDSADAKESKKNTSVDFRKLKELMPAELAGIKRTKVEGQKVSAAGFSISQAEGSYEKDADKDDAPKITVTMMDYGSNQEIAAATAAWANADLDQESDNGYTKTVKVAGHPGLETWDKENKTGNLQLYVSKRFIVTVNVEHMDPAQIQKAAKALPLDKLAALAKEAA